MIKVRITKFKPNNKWEWNSLVSISNSISQHTDFDKVQEYYNEIPYYFEILLNDKLVGGIKVLWWESSLLPNILKPISRRLRVDGQILIKEMVSISDKQRVVASLYSELNNFCQRYKITKVILDQVNFFNIPDFSIEFKPALELKTIYQIAVVDLDLKVDVLWENLHSKHRNIIRKAEKEGVEVRKSTDISLFLYLLKNTYSNQSKEMPNAEFITRYYQILNKSNSVTIYVAYKDNIPLASAMITHKDNYSDYTFGGTVQNSIGAGNYLHWEIIKEMKMLGYKYYSFGQVAIEKDPLNVKFSSGITSFKKRFGTIEFDASKRILTINKINDLIWNMILKLYNLR